MLNILNKNSYTYIKNSKLKFNTPRYKKNLIRGISDEFYFLYGSGVQGVQSVPGRPDQERNKKHKNIVFKTTHHLQTTNVWSKLDVYCVYILYYFTCFEWIEKQTVNLRLRPCAIVPVYCRPYHKYSWIGLNVSCVATWAPLLCFNHILWAFRLIFVFVSNLYVWHWSVFHVRGMQCIWL